MSEHELVDVVDTFRRKTGEVLPRSELFKRQKHFLSVHVWIVNQQKQFLLQKRDLIKKVDPGLWSVCGGVVLSDETSQQAAIRETREEIGLSLSSKEMVLAMPCNICDKWGSFVDVWLARADCSLQGLKLQAGEVSEAAWFDAWQMRQMFASGEASPNISFAFSEVCKFL